MTHTVNKCPSRAELSQINGLSIKDVAVMPRACELTEWRERGLIDLDVDRGIFVLTDAGRSRIRACCATCVSWKVTHPNAAGGRVGECHNEERIGDGMRRLTPPLSHYYETCEAHHER